MKKSSCLLLLLLIPFVYYGQSIQLEASFGSGGKVTYDFNLSQSHARDLFIQNDGKIVVGGYATTPDNDDYAIARFEINGQLDSTFGSNGKTLANYVENLDDKGFTFARLANGEFYLGGLSSAASPTWGYAKFLQNGHLDTTVLVNGTMVFDPSPLPDTLYSISLQNDGKLLLGGWTAYLDFCIMRVFSNGGVDMSFGEFGTSCLMLLKQERLMWMLVQEDGKILAGGGTEGWLDNEEDFSAIRFHIDGTLDTTFGDLGVFNLDMGFHFERSISAMFDLNGNIVMAGYGGYGDSLGFNMIRLNPVGQMDSTFGNSGIIKANFVPYVGGKSILLLPDGKILAVGSASNGIDEDFVLMCFMPNGQIDSTFGQNGMLLTDFGGSDDRAISVAYDSSRQSIVVVGESSTDTCSVFAIAKYSLDTQVGIEEFPSFIRDVKVYPNPSTSESQLYFSLKSPEYISINIFDIQGRLVKQIASHQFFQTGDHTLDLLIKDLASGTYNLQLRNKNAILQTVRFIKTP